MNNDDVVRDAEGRVKDALYILAARRDRLPADEREGLQVIIESIDSALWRFYQYLPHPAGR